jgi:D-tagatose-1,6-bisphosphate aldolase subunit GatZ/KbaZ
MQIPIVDPNTGPHFLDEVVRAQKRGEAAGLASLCSANPFVLEAALTHALGAKAPLLIESTCNQVNQYGGYTGMDPAGFAKYVHRLADKFGFPPERLLLGGDHLGPYPWRDAPAEPAMEKARALVRDSVLAGYTKIHLDASMKCADDDPDRPLDPQVSARRAAELAQTAEAACRQLGAGGTPPRYVIGTEVPLPGGLPGEDAAPAVTPAAEVEHTLVVTRQAFLERGLESAWERVIAVVVQPGVEYGDQAIYDYRRDQAAALARLIRRYDRIVYEAHSTDYQTGAALRNLVQDHFAILKVGPALTFAFREAVFALALIEAELFPEQEVSDAPGALERAMQANPADWQPYYSGSEAERSLARKYSFSDRSRYYWPDPGVQAALGRLLDNLARLPIPLALLSQYLPAQYERVRGGALANRAPALIHDKIAAVLADYATACGQASPRGEERSSA